MHTTADCMLGRTQPADATILVESQVAVFKDISITSASPTINIIVEQYYSRAHECYFGLQYNYTTVRVEFREKVDRGYLVVPRSFSKRGRGRRAHNTECQSSQNASVMCLARKQPAEMHNPNTGNGSITFYFCCPCNCVHFIRC